MSSNPSPRARATAVAAATLLEFVLVGAASAQVWVGSGSWDNKDNWNPKQVPTASTGVEINGTAQVFTDAASYEARLGYIKNESGRVEVKTPDGKWGNSFIVYAGYAESSTGTIDVSAQGRASTSGLLLGFSALSAGGLQVSDSGSRFDTNGMTIGWIGEGQMQVLGGGYVGSAGGGYLGYKTGSAGHALISGAGSFWELGGDAFVGYDGTADVTVQQGGKVTSGALTIGGGVPFTSDGRRGNGQVVITGKGSSWASSGLLAVGSVEETNAFTSGDLRVLGGASFSAASFAQIALGPKGSVLVSGAGSRWSVAGSDHTRIGVLGEGKLSVLDGATAVVDSPTLRLAWDYVSNGTLLVSGRGSTLTSKGEIQVGELGTATMTVDDGALAIAPQVTVRAYRGGGTPVPNVLNLNGGTTPESRGVLQVNTIFLDGGRIAFNGGVLRAASDQANMVRAASISVGSRGAFVDSNNFAVTIDARFDGIGGLTKLGDGTLMLIHSASTYLGPTIVERGTLRVSTPFFTSANMLPSTTELVIGNEADQGSAMLELSGIPQQVGALRSAGKTMPRIITNGATTDVLFTVDQATDTVYDGQLTGNLALLKRGEGQLVLGGVNTYGGLTTVHQGKLVVNGSLAGNAIVESGATLKGTGTIAGTVTVNDGGIFAPGTSPGTLTVGSLLLGPASEVSFELSPTASDHVVVQHDLAMNGLLRFSTLDGYRFQSGEVIPLFDVGGTASGTFASVLFPASAGDIDFSLGFANGTLSMTVVNASPVAEPASWGLLLAGLALLAARQKAAGLRPLQAA